MLPSVIIIGAQRSGTTTLYRMLSSHPAVLRPTASKGIGYFDVNYDRGMRWYQGHFPLARQRPAGAVTFESSGYYSYHPLAVRRLAADLPEVKLLMMLREPVDRAYSAHRHEFNRGFETESFERALDLEPARLAGEVERMLEEPGYQSYSHRHHSYLGRSRYIDQVLQIHRLVGPERLYLVDANRFFAAPHEEFAAIQRWLGLPSWQPEKVGVWNAQPREPLDPALRRDLEDYFDPFDRALEREAGIRLSWRS
ncbi:sulfotransferase [Paenarthrobacter sp. DKR-5]|nr:sulfotransferase [Paenarthrobacter sp. DKR-5]